MRSDPDAMVIADCGPTIGMGHLRRSLCLAEAMRDAGMVCTFAIPDEAGAEIVADSGFEVMAWSGDASSIPPAPIAVVDSYRVNEKFLEVLSGRTPFRVMIDDLADRRIAAELVINYNIFADDLSYDDLVSCPLLSGPHYALVNPAFFASRGKPPAPAPGAIVTFGGTDDGSLCAWATRALLAEREDLTVDVVVSPLATPGGEIRDLASRHRNRVRLHHGADMAQVMSGAGLYFGGAGLTVLEAAAAGLDIIAVEMGENHRLNAAALRRLGYIVLSEFTPGAATAAVGRAFQDSPANPLADILDGKGARRAAAEIIARAGIAGATQPARAAGG